MRRWAALIVIAGLALLVVVETSPRRGAEEHVVVIGGTAQGELTVTHQVVVEADAHDIAREMVLADRRTPSITEEVLRGRVLTAAPRALVQTGPHARPLRSGTVLPALTLFGATLLIVRLVDRRRT